MVLNHREMTQKQNWVVQLEKVLPEHSLGRRLKLTNEEEKKEWKQKYTTFKCIQTSERMISLRKEKLKRTDELITVQRKDVNVDIV